MTELIFTGSTASVSAQKQYLSDVCAFVKKDLDNGNELSATLHDALARALSNCEESERDLIKNLKLILDEKNWVFSENEYKCKIVDSFFVGSDDEGLSIFNVPTL